MDLECEFCHQFCKQNCYEDATLEKAHDRLWRVGKLLLEDSASKSEYFEEFDKYNESVYRRIYG